MNWRGISKIRWDFRIPRITKDSESKCRYNTSETSVNRKSDDKFRIEFINNNKWYDSLFNKNSYVHFNSFANILPEIYGVNYCDLVNGRTTFPFNPSHLSSRQSISHTHLWDYIVRTRISAVICNRIIDSIFGHCLHSHSHNWSLTAR